MDVVLKHYFHDIWASSLSHCFLIALSRCKFDNFEFFMPLWNTPQSSFKNRKKCRWCALSAALPQKQARRPLFFFIILIITILPFNGNSITSGEGSCGHTVSAWKTRRNVELDGPKAVWLVKIFYCISFTDYQMSASSPCKQTHSWPCTFDALDQLQERIYGRLPSVDQSGRFGSTQPW